MAAPTPLVESHLTALREDVAAGMRLMHHEYHQSVRVSGDPDDKRKYVEWATRFLEPKRDEKDMANLPVFHFNFGFGGVQATIDVPATEVLDTPQPLATLDLQLRPPEAVPVAQSDDEIVSEAMASLDDMLKAG